jgi:tetratricopeptide (TPR) repeat protein
MRNILLPIFLFITSQLNFSLLAQQGIIKGIVTIQNSSFNNKDKMGFVQDAQVEGLYVKTKPTLTDANGLFSLKIIGAKVAEKVRLKVHKEGFRVINPSDLSAVIDQNDTVRIVMAKPEDIEAMRLQLYAVCKTTAESAFQYKLKVYNKGLIDLKNRANTEGVQTVENPAKLLSHCAKNVDDRTQEIARKYSLVNLDDASTEYQKAFDFFQKGAIDSALRVFERTDLSRKADFIAKTKSDRIKKGIKTHDLKLEEQLRKIIGNYTLQTDMYRLNWELEKADSMYQLMLKYDSANVAIYKQFGAFLVEINQLNRAKNTYEKGVTYAQLSEDKMLLMNNLGDLRRQLNDAINGEKILTKAADMAEWEIINNKELFEPIYATTQYYLGRIYTDLKAYDKADNAYNNALAIRKDYLPKTNATLKDSLVLVPIFNGKAVNYLRQNNYSESTQYFDKVKTIYDGILDSSTCHKRAIATLKNNYAQLFFSQKDTSNTLKSYQEELAIYANLNREQPTVFEADYLNALNNLSKTYGHYKLFDKAIMVLDTLVVLQKQRVSAQPQQYEIDLDKTFIALNSIYQQQKKYVLIDSLFKMRIELHKTIAKGTPEGKSGQAPQYKPEICKTLLDFAAFYKNQNKGEDANRQYLKAIELQRELTEKEPLIYGENLQVTLQMFVERYDSLALKEIFEKKIKALRDTQSHYRHEKIEVQTKIVAAYEKATTKDKTAKLNEAYSNLAAYYLSVNKIKEAELIAQKQDYNAAHFLIFVYGIQDKFNEAQLVLAKIGDKKVAKTRCLQWANDFYNQKIITHDVKSKINKWFETSTTIGLQGR